MRKQNIDDKIKYTRRPSEASNKKAADIWRPLEEMRVQKLLAQQGFGSRREIERWIQEGRVSVNRKPVELGAKIKASDIVELDGKRLTMVVGEPFVTRVLIYNKPVGEVSTRKDEENRPTIFDTLPKVRQGRWITVGRLDINTAGLMVFTNDGECAAKLMHPSYEIEREYAVRVIGDLSEEAQDLLRYGIQLDDGPAKLELLEPIGGDGMNRWWRVVVKEGRNREIRRIFSTLNITVNRLIRVRYGNVDLPRDLRTGHHRELKADQVAALLALVEKKK